MYYSGLKNLVGAIDDNTCSKLSLGFKRFFSMLLMIGWLISGTLQQSLYEDYVPLLPGQHFYAKAMIGTIDNSARLSYGGWFQGVGYALKLKDMTIDTPAGPENMSLPTRMQYRYSPGFNLSISTNTWVFVMWNTVCTGTNQFISSLNGTDTSFCPVNLEGADSSHYHASLAVTGDIDIAPIYFGDPLINGTSWFNVEINKFRQSGLFYATTSNLSALYERTPQYMLGPYKGVKRGHKGFKFSIGITNMKMYQAADDNPISMYSTESLQKLLVDPFGTYIPAGKYIEYENFFDPAINQWVSEPDNARSLFIQWRMRRNVAGSTAIDENDSWNCNQTMHFQFRSTPGETTEKAGTIDFTIQRGGSRAWCRVKAIGAGAYLYDFEYDLSEIYQSDISGAGVLYSMKIGMVLVQNDTETWMPGPIFNLIIEFASREAGAVVIKKVIKVWPRVDTLVNPFAKFTARIVHTHTSITTNILTLYLDTLNEVRGGFMLNAMGFQGNSSTSDYCIGQTAVLSGSSMRFYCQICSGGILDVASGLCMSESSITGKNSTCDHWVSKDMCHSCPNANFYISQVQRICIPKADPCSDITVDLSYVFDLRNMFGNSCNDVKYYDNATGCTQYSNPVPGGFPCVCDVSNCEKCLHTQCDQCSIGYILFNEGDNVTCEFPVFQLGYGVDEYDSASKMRPCMIANCEDCSVDYKYCTICVPPYIMDSIARTCVLCETMNSRYFDTSTQTCHSCHPSCKFCTGPLSTDCIACPTSNTWLRIADNLCRDCRPTANDKYTAPNGTVFGAILDVLNHCELCNYPCATCFDTTICLTCRPGLYMYLNSTCGSCTEPNMYISVGTDCNPCHTSCATCNGTGSNDCTSCDASSSLYLFADGSCKACNLSNGYYLGDGNTCTTCTVSGYYKDSSNPALPRCKKCEASCLECNGSLSTNCLTCPTGKHLSAKHDCINCMTAGRFVRQDNSLCDYCDSSCVNCSNTSTNCTECDTANGYILVSSQCVENPSKFEQVKSKFEQVESKFDRDTQTWKLGFSKKILLVLEPNTKLKGVLSVRDLTSDTIFDCTGPVLTCEIINIVENGFSIKFTSSTGVMGGLATLKNESIFTITANDTGEVYGQTSIEIVLRSPGLEMLGNSIENTLAVTSTIRVPSAAIALASPGASMFLDLLVNDMLVLSLYAGPIIYYPDLILYYIPKLDLMPFDIPGTKRYVEWTQEEACQIPVSFEQAGVQCSVLANFGQDFIVLLITLGINIVVSLAHIYQIITDMVKKDNKLLRENQNVSMESSSNEILGFNNTVPKEGTANGKANDRKLQKKRSTWPYRLHGAFGLQYFLIKMFSIQQEVYIYFLTNLLQSNRKWQSILGLLAGLALVSLLIWITACVARSCYWVFENMKKLRQSATSSDQDMSEVIREQEHPCSYVDFVWDGLKVPISSLSCWTPFVSILRMVLLAAVLQMSIEEPAGQVLSGILIEVGYLIFFIKSNIRASKIEFWAETGTQGMTVAYLALKLITTMDINQYVRQQVIGVSMFILLVLNIVTQLSVFIYILISLLVEKIRQYKVKQHLAAESTKPNNKDKSPESSGTPSTDEADNMKMNIPIPKPKTIRRPRAMNKQVEPTQVKKNKKVHIGISKSKPKRMIQIVTEDKMLSSPLAKKPQEKNEPIL